MLVAIGAQSELASWAHVAYKRLAHEHIIGIVCRYDSAQKCSRHAARGSTQFARRTSRSFRAGLVQILIQATTRRKHGDASDVSGRERERSSS